MAATYKVTNEFFKKYLVKKGFCASKGFVFIDVEEARYDLGYDHANSIRVHANKLLDQGVLLRGDLLETDPKKHNMFCYVDDGRIVKEENQRDIIVLKEHDKLVIPMDMAEIEDMLEITHKKRRKAS